MIGPPQKRSFRHCHCKCQCCHSLSPDVVSERTSQRALRTEYVNENTVQPPWELAAVVVDTLVSYEQPTNYSYCALPLFIAALVVVWLDTGQKPFIRLIRNRALHPIEVSPRVGSYVTSCLSVSDNQKRKRVVHAPELRSTLALGSTVSTSLGIH